MTHDTDRQHPDEAAAACLDGVDPAGGAAPRLLTVSVVIVSRNYARYLGAAVASVIVQTYPRVGCLVVDNGFSDQFDEVLEEAARCHPALRVLSLPASESQITVCVRGFATIGGPYLIFLDAGDTLLLHALATHMMVHLVQERWRGKTFFQHLKRLDVPAEDGGLVAARCVVARCESIVEVAGRPRTLFLAMRGLALPTPLSLALRKGNRT